MAAEAAREPLTIDAENRLAFIEPGSSYILLRPTTFSLSSSEACVVDVCLSVSLCSQLTCAPALLLW